MYFYVYYVLHIFVKKTRHTQIKYEKLNNSMVDLNENTTINIPLRNLIALIFAVAICVSGYINVMTRITQLEHDRNIRDVEIAMNSEFRIKWPRGELGALPDDAEQNLRLQYIEKHLEEVEKVTRSLQLQIKENQTKENI